MPMLAKRLGHDLAKSHISVIPICGVAFETFKKLLDPTALGIPVAIVTDADPPVVHGKSWNEDAPENEGSAFRLCARTANLVNAFSGHQPVKVFHSQVTLEYDLAEAGDDNSNVMATIWEDCFIGTPGTFNRTRVVDAGNNRKAKAIATGRGICRADHGGSKAEFAQRLAAKVAEKDENGQWKLSFDVPTYLEEAITYVITSCNQSALVPEASTQ